MSSYRDAINNLTQTIHRRAKIYRNLIVAVTILGSGSIAGAAIVRSWLPLSFTFLLVPLCGIYLTIDAKILNHWRQELLAYWEQGEIDFSAFYEAVMGISTLPMNSVEGMLNTLPNISNLVEEQSILTTTRTATTAVVTMIFLCRSDRIKLEAMVYTAVGSAALIALVLWRWQPLLGVLIIPIVRLLMKLIKRQRLKKAKDRLVVAQRQPDFSLEQYTAIVKKIDRRPMSSVEINGLLAL